MKPPAMLTRSTLSHEVAHRLDISLSQAEIIVGEIVAAMLRSLQSREEIEIRGFGCFRLHVRGGRQGRNPKTGAAVSVPPKTVVHFKPSKEIVQSLLTAPPPGLTLLTHASPLVPKTAGLAPPRV
jgi:integration host factor subunit beta